MFCINILEVSIVKVLSKNYGDDLPCIVEYNIVNVERITFRNHVVFSLHLQSGNVTFRILRKDPISHYDRFLKKKEALEIFDLMRSENCPDLSSKYRLIRLDNVIEVAVNNKRAKGEDVPLKVINVDRFKGLSDFDMYDDTDEDEDDNDEDDDDFDENDKIDSDDDGESDD